MMPELDHALMTEEDIAPIRRPTEARPDTGALGPCGACLSGNHTACTGVGCYRCSGPHRMSDAHRARPLPVHR